MGKSTVCNIVRDVCEAFGVHLSQSLAECLQVRMTGLESARSMENGGIFHTASGLLMENMWLFKPREIIALVSITISEHIPLYFWPCVILITDFLLLILVMQAAQLEWSIFQF